MPSTLTFLKPSSLCGFLYPKDHMTSSHDSDREDGWKALDEGHTVRKGLVFLQSFRSPKNQAGELQGCLWPQPQALGLSLAVTPGEDG